MINLESLLMLIRVQQLQQLQSVFSTEESQNSLDSNPASNPLSFAGILAGLLENPTLLSSSEFSLRNSTGNPTNYDSSNNTPLQTGKANDNNSLNGLDAIFESFASQYGLQPNLLKSVAKIESNFNPQAISEAGAQGIMQLMPKTAEGLGVKNSFNPIENIEGGAKYLRQLLDRFDNNIPLALAAYNAGPGAVNKYGGIPPYKETQNYVKKVMDNMIDLIG